MVDWAKRVEKLEALLNVALARIVELEGKLGLNSGNSSKSPSSDMGRKRKPPVAPSGRKPGGQPGHEGQAREQVPPEEVDATEDVDPSACENCGEDLGTQPRLDACIRQVTETPEFKAFVLEFRLWSKVCPKCGRATRAGMPAGSPKGAFGPRLQARIALLSGRFRLTRRETRAVAKSMFGIKISLGSVQACCEAVSAVAAPTTEAIHEEVKHAPEVNADETGFGRCGKKRMWLWVAATKKAEAFRLLPGRGQAQALDLLGEGFAGFLSRDRWKPYEQFKKALHQLCHGHIRRDFQSMLESGGETGTQGAMLKLASDRAFHLWHQFERGEIDRATLIRLMKPIRVEFRQRLTLLRDGSTITKKARGTAKDLLRQWDSLWTYVDMEGPNPTNNAAESSIRKAVLWRKGSFGAQSESGCRFVERLLTLVGTARKRSIDLLDWLTRAIQADLEGKPAPSFEG
jgi:transposase